MMGDRVNQSMAYQPPNLNPEDTYINTQTFEIGRNIYEADIRAQEQNNRLTLVFQYCRSIKTFALVDLIFGFFYLFFLWPYIFTNFLIILGYLGAKNYNKNLIVSYLVYTILAVVFRFYLFYEETLIVWKLVYILLGLVEIYIVSFVIIGFKKLGELNARDLSILKNGWEPTIVIFRYY